MYSETFFFIIEQTQNKSILYCHVVHVIYPYAVDNVAYDILFIYLFYPIICLLACFDRFYKISPESNSEGFWRCMCKETVSWNSQSNLETARTNQPGTSLVRAGTWN